ncbi:MAG TPA: hypothetical protein VFF64_13830 [Candidatus Eremiobacteraceae bacterium]|nr:hypothetical protein [Candidatus Eremiobacteraceae bacterium]
MSESEDGPSPKQIGGTIPLFFYDLVGHIVPGTALVFGLWIYFRPSFFTSWLTELQTAFPKDSTAGYAAAIIVLFFACAHFCGGILSPLSYLVFEEMIFKKLVPLNMKCLETHYEIGSWNELHTRFKGCFGTALPGSIDRASALCAYYVWRCDSNLGLLTARTDADLLGARSLALVFLILFVLPFFSRWTDWPPLTLRWALCVGTILVSSLLTFRYLREKRVFVRFALFMTVTDKSNDSSGTQRPMI